MTIDVLVIGTDNPVGDQTVNWLEEREKNFAAFPSYEINYTGTEIQGLLKRVKPDFVINTQTPVVVKKSDQGEPNPSAYTPVAAQILASACADRDIPLIQLSSATVFNSQSGMISEEHKPDSDTELGACYRQMETAIASFCDKHLILRTNWVFAHSGANLMTELIELLKQNQSLNISAKRMITPTFAGHVGQILAVLIDQLKWSDELWGIYHYQSSPVTSLYDFTEALAAEAGQYEKLPSHTFIEDDGAHWRNLLPEVDVNLSTRRILYTFGIKQKSWRQGLSQAVRQYYLSKPLSH